MMGVLWSWARVPPAAPPALQWCCYLLVCPRAFSFRGRALCSSVAAFFQQNVQPTAFSFPFSNLLSPRLLFVVVPRAQRNYRPPLPSSRTATPCFGRKTPGTAGALLTWPSTTTTTAGERTSELTRRSQGCRVGLSSELWCGREETRVW